MSFPQRQLGLRSVFGVVFAVSVLVGVGLVLAGDDSKRPTEDPAVARARDQVKMLDELYKTAVVSITERFPRGQPAIMVAKDMFYAMENSEHHSAKLVDASGAPLGADSEPETAFEEKAAEAMQNGETYLDQVVGEGDNRRLLAATVVPAVHQRCAECHGVEKGDLLGFIRYEVPIK